jgi:hypothetical protein
MQRSQIVSKRGRNTNTLCGDECRQYSLAIQLHVLIRVGQNDVSQSVEAREIPHQHSSVLDLHLRWQRRQAEVRPGWAALVAIPACVPTLQRLCKSTAACSAAGERCCCCWSCCWAAGTAAPLGAPVAAIACRNDSNADASCCSSLTPEVYIESDCDCLCRQQPHAAMRMGPECVCRKSATRLM